MHPRRPQVISVLGAECTGKTELCRALASAFQGLTFEETLRAWVRERGRPPTLAEQSALFMEQCEQEKSAIQAAKHSNSPLVFVDSGPLMTAVYSQVYFSDLSLLSQALAWQARYDLTLVCRDDLPWEPDPGQRDGEGYRSRAQAALNAALETTKGLVIEQVFGRGVQRVSLASAFLNRLHCESR